MCYTICAYSLLYVADCVYTCTCCVQIESLHALLEQERSKNKILKLEVAKLQVPSINMHPEDLILLFFHFILL